jgi:adenosylcobinamide-phosphate synthase
MPAEIWIVPAALAAEAAIGYPQWLYARIAHPVVWMGALIASCEARLNSSARGDLARRFLGVATVLLVCGLAAASGYVVQLGAERVPFGELIIVLVATTGLAQRSLYTHVRDVLRPLQSDDLARARVAVSHIVGRDTASLSRSGVAAAALESLAESFNDGIVAPVFWFAIGGLPGLFAYKALNTADSLIGHREPRWLMFGWAAARADDLANLMPARIAGLLLVLAGGGRGGRIMLRDAPKHASPNAGWPEAAMAGTLAVRLGGPASYDGHIHERPVFGNGTSPDVADLARGMRIYVRACALLWLAALAVVAVGSTWPR